MVVPPLIQTSKTDQIVMPDIDATKRALRTQVRQQRDDFVNRLGPGEKALTFSVAPSPLSALFGPGKTVAAYVPIGSEANPLKLLEAAEKAGCEIALPHVTSKAAPMRFLQWSNTESLALGPFGLQQPDAGNRQVTPDVILVPLIAFDRALNRLGQGAAHYDRALSLLGNSLAIGVGWSMQEQPELDVDDWDIPLDAVLTEREWITA